MSYKLGLSYATYENLITEIHTSGGNIGQKNHSKEFSQNLLGPMYEVLRNSIVSFVTDNKLPSGLLADKITAKHGTHHIIGIRVAIWDVNSPLHKQGHIHS